MPPRGSPSGSNATRELLDNLQDREFTDLDLPSGFGPDQESETIARRGLTRLYWTREMGVHEMQDLIAELPTADAKESAEIVRKLVERQGISDWACMLCAATCRLLRRRLRSPISRKRRLRPCLLRSSRMLSSGVGPQRAGGFAAIFLGDLASREVYPGVAGRDAACP